ncbi:MAG TPA: hypothetical protein VGR16_08915 [Thermomicrobiales bacterium]|nr:hypothetical protein [Thermomicrobiales bacterium]
MPYLIDSDWLIDHLLEDQVAVALLNRLTPAGIAMSAISYMEAFESVIRRAEPTGFERFGFILENVPVIPVSQAIAERCARISGSH